ncbi:hypothetical protein C942_00125 [Photobacterium marinum]|uniref:Lipoprotein n=1 Tax=Photobacterium marinum TaxID=1056511 RepID=L8JHX2_9GAMM|nr:DUF2931 family protein [Photobacterium marinum]ELR67818.1 hypothetical protein C942_00125 [Photobacterium marinum]
MTKNKIIFFFFAFILTACAKAQHETWGYGFTAAADEVFNTEIRFVLPDNKTELRPLSVGISGAFLPQEILNGYFAFRGFSGPKQSTPYPIRAYVEWVSFVDKKRYGIWLNFPTNLDFLTDENSYISGCGKGWQMRRILNFGVAPGGYIETYVGTGCEADRVILHRNIASEVQTEYDKTVPLASQFKNRFKAFDEKNQAFIKKHSIPYWRFQLGQPPIATSRRNNNQSQ